MADQRFGHLDLPRRKYGPDQTAKLLELSIAGDKTARDKLVGDNLRLVVGIARRFASWGYELEDLFQIGSIGLIKAIDKYDPCYGVQFSTYAVPMIIGEIRRFIRDDGPIKVSRSLKETATKVRHAKQKLVQNLGREPTLSEISEEIGIDIEQLVAAQEATRPLVSFASPVYQEDGATLDLEDRLRQDNHGTFDYFVLSEAIQRLTPREQFIIQQRYFGDRTQAEIAKELDLSQVQISRLEKRILIKLRAGLTNG